MEVSASPASVGVSAARLERVRAWMRRQVDEGRLPGTAVTMARRGKVVMAETYGHADVESGLGLEPDTIMRFYSMAKPVTIVTALSLYEEGAFQLDDPVSAYLPAFSDLSVWVSGEGDDMITEPARRPMQVRDLMMHTSGLTYGFIGDTPVEAGYRERGIDFSRFDGDLAETVDRLAREPLLAHPGEAWNYSVSIDVIGRLVEVWSGQRFERVVGERVFEPLGMVDSGFSVPADRHHRFASAYAPTEDRGIELLDAAAGSRFCGDVTLISGGGGLVSTAPDYLRFAEMLRRGGALDGTRVLGRKTVELMTRNHLPGGVDMAAMGQARFSESTYAGVGFGLGVSVMIDPAAAMIAGTPGEFAWGGQASTAFWVDPAEALTVIFLTQLLPSSTYPLRRELRVLTYQALVD